MRWAGILVFTLLFQTFASGESGDLLWSQIHPRVDRLGFTALAESDQGIVAVGWANPIDLTAYPGLYYSKEGREWLPGSIPGAVRWRAVAGSGNGFVAVGDGGAIAFSKHGYVWNEVESGVASHLSDVMWTGSAFVAAGDEGHLLRSTDGKTWQNQMVVAGVGLRDVFLASGLVHAAGASLLLSSADEGETWTTRDLGPQANVLRGSAGPGGIWLYSESGGRREFYRENGTGGWEILAAPGGRTLVGLGFKESKGFLALNDQGSLLFSEDGVKWTASAEAIAATGVLTGAGDGWIVAGNQGELLRIGAGRGWNAPVALQSGANAVARHAGRFYAFGHYGRIYWSLDGVSWVSGSSTGSSDVLRAGVVFDGKLIAVGARGAVRRIDAAGAVSFGYVGSLADLRGVASSGTRLVAVGLDGVIYRSNDGVAWTSVVSPATKDLHSISYVDGRFRAVGAEGVTIESVDGVNWEVGAVGTDATLFAVGASGGDLLVAGSGGVIYRKPAGGGWIREESGTMADLHAVFESADGIHVCGDGGTVRKKGGDGVWRRETIRFASTCNFRSGVVADGRMLLVGHSGFYEESVTCSVSQGWAVAETVRGGIDILRRPYSGLEAVVAVPDGFLAAGWNGRTLLSTDGEHWSDGDFPAGWTIRDLAVGDGLILAAGEQGIMVSDDGREWAPVNYHAHEIGPCSHVDPAKRLRRVVRGESDWLAVGFSGAVLRSVDGLTWHRPADPAKAIDASTLTGAANGAGVWVISGESGKVRVSGDGEEWLVVQTPTNRTILDVVHFGGRFLASISDAPDEMLESADGMNWVKKPGISGWRAGLLRLADGRCFGLGSLERISSTVDGTSWRSHGEGSRFSNDSTGDRPEVRGIAFRNGVYVAVGTFGMIARSVDRDQWTRIHGGEVRGFRRVSWFRDRLVALADPGVVLSSADGRRWTSHRAGDHPHEQLVAMVDSGSRALAVGKTVLVSDDLVTWVETGCPAGKEFTSVAWDGQRFIAGAKSGETYHSDDGAQWTLGYATGVRIEDVAGIEGLGMALHGARLSRLADGASWAQVPGNWGTGDYRHLYMDGTRFLATGAETFSLWSSDGLNWERIFHPTWWPGRVANGGAGLFALSPDPVDVFSDRLLGSPDGREWTALPRFLPDRGVSVVAESGCVLTFHERGEVMLGLALSSPAFQTEALALQAPFYSDLGPEEDANGDGIANVVARYFGLNVVEPNPAGVLALPRLSLRLAESGALSVTLPSPAETVPYLRLVIEAGVDLEDWVVIAARDGNGAWEALAGGTFTTNFKGEVVLVLPHDFQPRFFRMRIEEDL